MPFIFHHQGHGRISLNIRCLCILSPPSIPMMLHTNQGAGRTICFSWLQRIRTLRSTPCSSSASPFYERQELEHPLKERAVH